MSFFSRIQQSHTKVIIADWKILNEESQIGQIKKDSFNRPVVIYKHSTTCGTSVHIKHDLENGWKRLDMPLDFYYLDILAFRPVSNLVAEEFGVVHQSPQVIILFQGQRVFDCSHFQIGLDRIRDAIDKLNLKNT